MVSGGNHTQLYCLVIKLTLEYIYNSLRPRLNRRNFADDVFKCNFLNQNIWIPITISLKFFLSFNFAQPTPSSAFQYWLSLFNDSFQWTVITLREANTDTTLTNSGSCINDNLLPGYWKEASIAAIVKWQSNYLSHCEIMNIVFEIAKYARAVGRLLITLDNDDMVSFGYLILDLSWCWNCARWWHYSG